MAKAHLIRTCRECAAQFVFTREEQDFYAEHRLPRPVLCPACLDAAREPQTVAALANGHR